MPSGSLNSEQSFPDDAQADDYLEWVSEDEFVHDPGTFELAVALTDDEIKAGKSPVSIGRLTPPTVRKITRWRAKKRGTPPVVPAPSDAGKAKFMGGSITIPKPTLTTTSVDHVWAASGEYHYVIEVPQEKWTRG